MEALPCPGAESVDQRLLGEDGVSTGARGAPPEAKSSYHGAIAKPSVRYAHLLSLAACMKHRWSIPIYTFSTSSQLFLY